MENNPYQYHQPRFRFLWLAGEFLLEIVKIVLISLAIIVPVRYFLIQPFYVKGASMEPNYENGDYLIINEAALRVLKREPARGEVVVFRYPKDPSQYFIKRVIGLPGETVEITDGQVLVYSADFPNGRVMDESEYLSQGLKTTVSKGSLRVTLEEGEYFVLGDNRTQSLDSRSFGPIHYNDIIGKAWVRGFPLHRIGVFEKPLYDESFAQ